MDKIDSCYSEKGNYYCKTTEGRKIQVKGGKPRKNDFERLIKNSSNPEKKYQESSNLIEKASNYPLYNCNPKAKIKRNSNGRINEIEKYEICEISNPKRKIKRGLKNKIEGHV